MSKTPDIRTTTVAIMCNLQNATSLLAKANPMPLGNDMNIRWVPPSHGRIKINFDGYVRSNSAAGGFILRTDNGKPLTAASFSFDTITVLVAEAMALRKSLICAKSRSFTKIDVEGDSKLVIDVVNGILGPPWKLLKIVHVNTSDLI
ncbi:hypothetical protein ACLB2K_016564 [Fragaria x ananassa]